MSKTWHQLQNNAEAILASGILNLKSSNKLKFNDKLPNDYGNYLISKNNIIYIGEAKDLKSRIKQQSTEKTSTFYKNYSSLKNNTPVYKISDFNLQILHTSLGRKEIEEFGIVNIPATLNRFQLDKRKVYNGIKNPDLWIEIQNHSNTLLTLGENELKKKSSSNWLDASPKAVPGLYWVENKKYGLIYIGESSSIKDRWQTHSKQTYFSALRRHIGENILNFELQTIKGKKRYFTPIQDQKINHFLKDSTIKLFPVAFGRYELEEFLIRKYKPLLNRKENK